ncbi:MAG TPA: peptidase MA family metallohydrolase [Polyangiales bacterium]|nr:peptidase MA family metallohydrolase [Polyangiales bacterium]
MSLRNGERKESKLRACVRAWVVVLMLALPSASRADADDDPADVITASALGVQLPPPPQGFLHERVGNVDWSFHKRDADLARTLQNRLAASWRQVTSELGREVSSELTIRVARGPEDMARLAPRNNPPPPYAVGVAYPSLGLIIVSVVSPDSWFPPDQIAVLTHELSHVALHRAVDGRPLPLWFVEGLATYQSGEHRLSRVRTLWEAALAGDVLPLDVVSRNFPSRPQAVNLAYAQSADLVRHLLQSTADRSRLAHLLAQVRTGVGFEQALLSAYRIDLPFLEREWRQGLNERFRVLPLVLTGTALWGGIALLAVVAFARRRQQHKEKLAHWKVEEAAEQAHATAGLNTPTVPAQPITVSEPRTIHVYALPPPMREAGVPTVEHDGQRHTLH